jgi:Fe-S cluster assembly protein SufD
MVTELVESKSSYQAAFRALRQSTPAVPWVELVRRSAMDSFELLGFPSIKDEDWKYTNLAGLAKTGFEPATIEALPEVSLQDVSGFGYSETATSRLVLLNGFLRNDLSSIGSLDKVVVLDLFSAIGDARYSNVVREHLARSASYANSALIALNTAFLQSGLFVLIPRNTTLEAPLQIIYVSDSRGSNGASFPRVLVVSEENSAATIIESFVSLGDGEYFSNSVGEIVLQDNARLEHYRVQNEGPGALHIGLTSVELGRGSSYNATSIAVGGRLSRHDIQVVMDHEGAECWVDGLYVVGSDQHADTHSVIDHKQPNCTSRQLYKGILDGNGRAVFNGKVFVRHGAQKTDANQINKNLLLSDRARVDTKPQLEIFADDVKCAHGAAVGQIDQDELFYLQTRGLNPDLARNLLTYGFAEEVIGKIKIGSIRAQLDEAVLNRLHTNLEAEVLASDY